MSNSRKAIWKSSSGVDDAAPPARFDVDEVEALLIGCAKARTDISYSEALLALGMRFSRPKMRSLCVVLGAVDARAAARGEPELAVLVVRESDRLPGQGWWVGRPRYRGLWEGPQAQTYIRRIQARCFRYWAKQK